MNLHEDTPPKPSLADIISESAKAFEYEPEPEPTPYAFPTILEGNEHLKGMTLRDYFAAKFMVVFLAERYDELSDKDRARMAYGYADEMLEVREENL